MQLQLITLHYSAFILVVNTSDSNFEVTACFLYESTYQWTFSQVLHTWAKVGMTALSVFAGEK